MQKFAAGKSCQKTIDEAMDDRGGDLPAALDADSVRALLNADLYYWSHPKMFPKKTTLVNQGSLKSYLFFGENT